MLKVLKNEFIKMINGKKLWIFIGVNFISIILMAYMAFKEPYAHIGTQNFLEVCLWGIVMRPIIPIFIILAVAETITEDYSKGTMKFSIITAIKKREIMLGKFLFLAFYEIIMLIISFVQCYIVQIFTLGIGNSQAFIYNIKCYFVIMLPLLAFSMIISLVSILIDNSTVVITINIALYFIVDMINFFVKSTIGSIFLGGLNTYRLIGKVNNYEIALAIAIAGLYTLIFLALNIEIIKKKDFVL